MKEAVRKNSSSTKKEFRSLSLNYLGRALKK